MNLAKSLGLSANSTPHCTQKAITMETRDGHVEMVEPSLIAAYVR